MKVIYICEPNCTIHKSLDTLIIKKGGYKLNTVPLIDAGCVVIFGNTQISTQALNVLFLKGIDLVFMSSSGLIKGRIISEKASNIILRIAQFDRWKNEEQKIKLAAAIIHGKINNQVSMLEGYVKHHPDLTVREIIKDLKDGSGSVFQCKDLQKLMGIEGGAAKRYFEAFSLMLKDYEFPGRQRRPAYEPVNALLNLTYAFLNNEIAARLFMYSFDVELGFLHGIRYGRKSLSLDLMEEFRALLADRFVLYLLNRSKIQRKDFEISEEGCVLNTAALKEFCRLYHEYIEINPSKDNNWIKIMDQQIRKFRKVILEGGEYKTYNRR